MKRSFLFIKISVIYFFIFSCTKEKQENTITIITGVVIDASTNLPISGAHIMEELKMYGQTTRNELGITDNNGNFTLLYDKKPLDNDNFDSNYNSRRYYIIHNGYNDQSIYYYGNSYCINKTVQLYPSTVLRLMINNASPHDSNDHFETWISDMNQTWPMIHIWESQTWNGITELNGLAVNDTLERFLYVNDDYTVHWQYTKNAITTDSSINIHTGWNDTVDLQINY